MTTHMFPYTERADGIFRGLAKYVDFSFLNGKRVLEVGYGGPSAGHRFIPYGASVTICDKEQENLDAIKAADPEVNTLLLNLQEESVSEKYDVIYDSDCLFLIRDPVRHLSALCSNADYLILDMLVLDNIGPELPVILNSEGCRCAPFFINETLTNAGFEFIMPIDNDFNCSHKYYGWSAMNDKECRRGAWRIWIAWRTGVPCPLRAEYAPVVAPAPVDAPVVAPAPVDAPVEEPAPVDAPVEDAPAPLEE